ncbi:MAP kinase kinase kinase [Aureococcus anophagefferens]|nr:MAP kinase kinase kinase [Aureococcus anophagefferens]
MEEEEAVTIFVDNGVDRRDAVAVTKRVRSLDADALVAGDTIAMLVEGLAPETQDALVAITARQPGGSPRRWAPPPAVAERRRERPPRDAPPRDAPPRDAPPASARRATPARPASGRRPPRGEPDGRAARGPPRQASLCNYDTSDLMFPPELLAEFQPARATQQSVRSYEAARASEDAASGRNLRSRSEPAPVRAERPPGIRPGKWKLGKLIGSGSYGTVFQGLRLDTGALIAIKTLILPATHDERDALREIEQLHGEIEVMSGPGRETNDVAPLSRSYGVDARGSLSGERENTIRPNVGRSDFDVAELERFRSTARSTGRLRRRSSLRHENIVEYLGAEIEEADRKLHIFQEWVPGGSLSAVVRTFGGRLDDDVNRRYLEHCLRGLVYLHEHRVVHRDVKGENVLISDTGVAKLADMGACGRSASAGARDVWAMGGLALLMATGDPPWKALKLSSPYALFCVEINHWFGGPPNFRTL